MAIKPIDTRVVDKFSSDRIPVEGKDSTWGGYGLTGHDTAPYQKYFYSGNDVFVFLQTYNSGQLVPIPVTDMGFGISQEKVPIYGYASYTWDAVARGTRVVRGEFTVVFTKLNFIGRLLGDPAKADYVTTDASTPVIIVDENEEVARRKSLRTSIWGYNADRSDLVNTIVNQQSREIVDTRDFELMKLMSDENGNIK